MQRLRQDANETGALLESLLAQPRYRLQLLAVDEEAMCLAKLDDTPRKHHVKTRHLAQQVLAAGIQIDAREADALGRDVIEGATQLSLVAVVLVETNSDVFGVDLDEFGERILQTTRDRD